MTDQEKAARFDEVAELVEKYADKDINLEEFAKQVVVVVKRQE